MNFTIVADEVGWQDEMSFCCLMGVMEGVDGSH